MYAKRARKVGLCAAIAACVFAGSQAFAGGSFDIDIVNAGFEDDILGVNNIAAPPAGWNAVGSGAWHPTTSAFPGGAAEGNNVAYILPGGSLSQVLSAQLQENTEYLLEVAIGNRNDFAFSAYSVELWAGNTMLFGEESTITPDPGTFGLLSLAYSAPVGEPLAGTDLEIRFLNHGSANTQVIIDDVRLTGMAVPGPAALAFLGMAGLAGTRRRRG